jgi:hypothetical protein
MSPVSLAVNNVIPAKVNLTRPRVGPPHGEPRLVEALRLLRIVARDARRQAIQVLENRRIREHFSRAEASVDSLATRQEEVGLAALDAVAGLDEASLLILENVLRALWVSSNPRRRAA